MWARQSPGEAHKYVGHRAVLWPVAFRHDILAHDAAFFFPSSFSSVSAGFSYSLTLLVLDSQLHLLWTKKPNVGF